MPLTFSELHNFTDSHHRKVISNDLFIWIAGLDLPSILLIVMIWKPHDSQRNLLATSRVIHFLKIGPIFQFSLWVVALVIFTPQRKGHGKIQEPAKPHWAWSCQWLSFPVLSSSNHTGKKLYKKGDSPVCTRWT